MPAVALLAILLQTATSPSGDGVAPPPSTATRASAVRAKTPVVIDGRDDDEVWRRRRKATRSEEHTSELQSRFDLVCRLLLEKKNTKLTQASLAGTAILSSGVASERNRLTAYSWSRVPPVVLIVLACSCVPASPHLARRAASY